MKGAIQGGADAADLFPIPVVLAAVVSAMSVQSARLENLRALVRQLEEAGCVTRAEQARYLGCATTARRLQTMLDGGHIHSLFAGHVDFVLAKPRGWFSTCQGARSSLAAAAENDEICERLGRFVVT
ncbi:MAG: hypothetical protein ABWX83_12915 [Luteibacter sp.]